MATTEDIFIGTDEPTEAVAKVLESVFGAPLTRGNDGRLYLRADGRTLVSLDGHEFDDDDLELPDGSPVQLHSDYPYWIEVRDLDGDVGHQQGIADQVFATLKSHGQWKVVYAHDMQRVVDRFVPQRTAQ